MNFRQYLEILMLLEVDFDQLDQEVLSGILKNCKDLMNDREDVLLKIIKNQKDDFSVTVYGMGHNFYDNINRWN